MDKTYTLSLPLANGFNAYVNAALYNNEISKDEWYEINNKCFTKLHFSPPDDEILFFKHITENYLADDGRLILGPTRCDNSDSKCKGIQKLLDSGITPNGYIEKTHSKNTNRLRRAVWFDKGSMKQKYIS